MFFEELNELGISTIAYVQQDSRYSVRYGCTAVETESQIMA